MTFSRRGASLMIRLAERVVGRQQVVRATRFLHREARLDGRNSIDVNGEFALQKAVLRQTAPPHTVLDVGGHFGEWSRSLLRAAADQPVDLHIFEPASFTFTELQRQMGGLEHITLNHVALSDAPGEANLRLVHEGAGTNSLVPFAPHGDLREAAVETVSVTTIDAYCLGRGIQRVALLKTDAEGNDLRILRGASQLLSDKAIDCLQFEYNHRWIDARTFLADAFALLEPYGYVIGKVTPRGVEFYPRWVPDLETFIEGNYVACHPELASRLPSLPWWNA